MCSKGKWLAHCVMLFLTFTDRIFSLCFRFYKQTGEIVAIKMIDLEAELLHDDQDTTLTAISQEIQFMMDCRND